jgi:hypothetical protein
MRAEPRARGSTRPDDAAAAAETGVELLATGGDAVFDPITLMRGGRLSCVILCTTRMCKTRSPMLPAVRMHIWQVSGDSTMSAWSSSTCASSCSSVSKTPVQCAHLYAPSSGACDLALCSAANCLTTVARHRLHRSVSSRRFQPRMWNDPSWFSRASWKGEKKGKGKEKKRQK